MIPRVFPILRRELITTLRSRQAFLLLFAYVVVLSVTFCTFWPDTEDFISNRKDQAREFFKTFALTQLLLIVLLAPAVTAPAISGEREARTLDLLVTTALGPEQVIRGKFLSGIVFLLFLLVASLPPLSLVFLLGGVAPSEVFLVYSMLLSSTLIFGMVGTVCSCFCQRTHNALLTAYLLILIVPMLFPLGPLLLLLALVIAFVAPLLLVSFVGIFAPYLFIDALFGKGGGGETGWILTLALCYLLLTLIIVHFLYRLALWRFARPDQGHVPNLAQRLRLQRKPKEATNEPRLVFSPIPTSTDPVYYKDLRTVVLGAQSHLIVTALAIFAAASVLILLGGKMPEDAHPVLYLIGQYTLVGLTVVALTAPIAATSGVFAERENRRLDLLYTTLVTPAHLVRAKFRLTVRMAGVLGGMVLLGGIAVAFPVASGRVDRLLLGTLGMGVWHFASYTLAMAALAVAIATWATTRLRALVVSYGTVFVLAVSYFLLEKPLNALARSLVTVGWTPDTVEWAVPALLDVLSPWWYASSLYRESAVSTALLVRLGILTGVCILVLAVSLRVATACLQPGERPGRVNESTVGTSVSHS